MSRGVRNLILVAGDCLATGASIIIAIWLRMEFTLPEHLLGHLPWLILLSIAIKLPTLWLAGMYSVLLTYISLRDALRLSVMMAVSAAVFAGLFLLLRTSTLLFQGFPLSAIVIDLILALLLLGGWRFSKRMGIEMHTLRAEGTPTVVVGAGRTADQVLRTLRNDPSRTLTPLALLDDDPVKTGRTLQGVQVLGTTAALDQTVARLKARTVIIAIPQAPTAKIREVYERSRAAGVTEILVVPDSTEIFRSEVSSRDLRQIELKDLLRRGEIRLDEEALGPFYKGRSILVTGAAGSIGAELSRQLMNLGPGKLILLDREETGLFNLHRELLPRAKGTDLVVVLSDVREKDRMQAVLREHRPQVVFHAAAYKHVPVLESNAEVALSNNVEGTINLAQACRAEGIERFVFISSDKAADPISIMGKTKRIGELLSRALDRLGDTRFSAVRFGNVLGSRGSVLETFAEQIKTGRSITITDPAMKRFFMLISEAVLLVLHAGVLSKGGEIFVLDMGEPILIRDLAEQMARLAGLEPGQDIAIETIGVRPGERVEERLHCEGEELVPTDHPKLSKAVPKDDRRIEGTEGLVGEIERIATNADGRSSAEAIDLILSRLGG
jgi:FlaA1/EpsC-like NDP-sugar epimerase